MAPYIYGKDEDGFLKPFQYLHPGIKQPPVPEKIYQPHVFQQSVTLTASMWDENESKGKMDWSFDNWEVLSKYSPLFIGLVCGFAVVLLIMSSVMLWRYCVISASNKLSCNSGTYGEMTSQQQKSLRKESAGNLAGFENFHSQSPHETPCCQPTLQRSATVGSVPLQSIGDSFPDKLLHHGVSANNIFLHPQSPTRLRESSHYDEPVASPDNYASHSYLQRLEATCSEAAENVSRSTPDLEDLYAKVNFSKKRKNRMRRNEAAIIAISKARNGQNNDSLESFGSAVVVYNERTAL